MGLKRSDFVFLKAYYVGCGQQDHTTQEFAELIASIVEYIATLCFESSKSDGALRKLLNGAKLFKLELQPTITLSEGLYRTYEDFLRV
jgi:GDP-L-fucose synthase